MAYQWNLFEKAAIRFFAIPVCIKMEYILSVWLEEVPKWTIVFCQLQLIQTVIVQMANPIATAIYGKGDIKGYAIWKSIMNIMPIILSIIAFSSEGSPIWEYTHTYAIPSFNNDSITPIIA